MKNPKFIFTVVRGSNGWRIDEVVCVEDSFTNGLTFTDMLRAALAEVGQR
jgi:hypothetical protein